MCRRSGTSSGSGSWRERGPPRQRLLRDPLLRAPEPRSGDRRRAPRGPEREARPDEPPLLLLQHTRGPAARARHPLRIRAQARGGPLKHGIGELFFAYVFEPGGTVIELQTGGYWNFIPDWETVYWPNGGIAGANTAWNVNQFAVFGMSPPPEGIERLPNPRRRPSSSRPTARLSSSAETVVSPGSSTIEEVAHVVHSIASALKPMYRMPVSFGPSAATERPVGCLIPGRRAADSVDLRLCALGRGHADGTAPRWLRARRRAGKVLTAGITRMYDIGWLAGRSYNIVPVTLPVVSATRASSCAGAADARAVGEPRRSNRHWSWTSSASEAVGRDPRSGREPPAARPSRGAHRGWASRSLRSRRRACRTPACGGRSGTRVDGQVRAPHRGVGRARRRLPHLRNGAATDGDRRARRHGEGRFAFHPARWRADADAVHRGDAAAPPPPPPPPPGRGRASWVMTATVGEPIGLNHNIVS